MSWKKKFREEDFARLAKSWADFIDHPCELGVPVRTKDGFSITVRHHPRFYELRYDSEFEAVIIYDRFGDAVMGFSINIYSPMARLRRN